MKNPFLNPDDCLTLAEVAEFDALVRDRQSGGAVQKGKAARYGWLAARRCPPVYREDGPERAA